jgi:hypothetical protein
MLKSIGVNLARSGSFGHPPEAAAPGVAPLSISLTVGTPAPTVCKKVLRVQSRLNSICSPLQSQLALTRRGSSGELTNHLGAAGTNWQNHRKRKGFDRGCRVRSLLCVRPGRAKQTTVREQHSVEETTNSSTSILQTVRTPRMTASTRTGYRADPSHSKSVLPSRFR